MKSKLFISVILAVLMLGILATPAFAGKPAKGDLYVWDDGPTGTVVGSVSLQRTHDNLHKLSLVLKGATPDAQYYIRFPNNAAYWDDSDVYANSQGVVRVKLTSTQEIMAASVSIVVDEAPWDIVWDFGTYAISVP